MSVVVLTYEFLKHPANHFAVNSQSSHIPDGQQPLGSKDFKNVIFENSM